MIKFDLTGYVKSIWEEPNFVAIARYVDRNCVFRDVSGNTRIVGIESLVANLKEWHDIFEDPRVEIRRVLEDHSSPTIVWDWVLTARPAIARNSMDSRAEVSIYGITIASIQDGRITEEINCTDMKEFVDLMKGSRE